MGSNPFCKRPHHPGICNVHCNKCSKRGIKVICKKSRVGWKHRTHKCPKCGHKKKNSYQVNWKTVGTMASVALKLF
jgi:hypothetical protein